MAAEKLTEQINDVKDAMTLFKEMTQQEKEQILMFMSGMKAAKELYQAGQTPAQKERSEMNLQEYKKDSLIQEMNSIIHKEYEEMKRVSKNYAELKDNCQKRGTELILAAGEMGCYVKNKFKEYLEKDLGEIKIPQKD